MRKWKVKGGPVRALAFSPDASTLACVTDRSSDVRLFDPLTGEQKKQFAGFGKVYAVAFGRDGRHVASLDYRGVSVWPVEGQDVAHVAELLPTLFNYRFLAFRDRLAVANFHEIVVWDDPAAPAAVRREPDQRERATTSNYNTVEAIRFTPDGSRLLVGMKHLDVWHADLSGRVHSLQKKGNLNARALACSRDGERLVMVVRNALHVWRAGDRAHEAELVWGGPKDFLYAAGFTRDGHYLMAAGSTGAVRFWSVGDWQVRNELDFGIGKVRAADLAPDGTLGAAGGEGGEVVVWDMD
jgi:WD40 repeat protein